jgi:superfamily I DNA/RNA helicase
VEKIIVDLGIVREEEEFKTAEELRLIYVTSARAKNLLLISKSLEDTEMKVTPGPLYYMTWI